MFWIKFILIAAILLVVLLLGLEFSTLNTNAVTVRYLLGTTTQPLSLVVICAFSVGVFVTALVGAFVVLPLRWQLYCRCAGRLLDCGKPCRAKIRRSACWLRKRGGKFR